MKKIIACALLIFAFICSCGLVSVHADYYAKSTIVVDVDYEKDAVTVKDFNGNLWRFIGCEDWEEGDICALLMDDSKTESIFDDVIVKSFYNGWVY